MELLEVVRCLEGAVAVCGSPDPSPAEVRDALASTTRIRGFIDARRAELVRALSEHPAAFPEATIAETSGCSLNQASRETERARTLCAAPPMADALSDGSITASHVDALTRASRSLDDRATASLLGGGVELAQAASRRSVAQFDMYIKRQAKGLDRTDGVARLERQKRATRLPTSHQLTRSSERSFSMPARWCRWWSVTRRRHRGPVLRWSWSTPPEPRGRGPRRRLGHPCRVAVVGARGAVRRARSRCRRRSQRRDPARPGPS